MCLAPASLRMRVEDDLNGAGTQLRTVLVRVILFGAEDSGEIDVRLNGHVLPLMLRDPRWKDPQIFSPQPQPASGGSGLYQVNPQQRLLRLEFTVEPGQCRQGENHLDIRLPARPAGQPETKVVLEKLELQVGYAP